MAFWSQGKMKSGGPSVRARKSDLAFTQFRRLGWFETIPAAAGKASRRRIP
jgi:hypothetical protein